MSVCRLPKLPVSSKSRVVREAGLLPGWRKAGPGEHGPDPGTPCITALGTLLCDPLSLFVRARAVSQAAWTHTQGQALAPVHSRCLINNTNENDWQTQERKGHPALEVLIGESISGQAGEKGTDCMSYYREV